MDNAQDNISSLPDNYLVDSATSTVYVRIQNITNPNCYDITSFNLGVNYLPIANQPDNLMQCDDSSNDGKEIFDLSSQNEMILNGQLSSEHNVSFHLSLNEAENFINPLEASFENTENPQTIFARLENSSNQDCFTTTSFIIEVMEQPILEMKDKLPICEGGSIQLSADAGFDTYDWSTGETTQSITVDFPGSYDVVVSNIYGDLICESSKAIEVVNSNIATIIEVETTDWSQFDNTILVLIEGDGDYEYSIDGINFQDSNQFSALVIDDYTVYVRDKNGCGITSEDVYLMYYPKFFTPNNDGYHDYWQIMNSHREPENRLYIYDRYGKLLQEISPTGRGWDGAFNGQNMPSSDYWFVLERQNGKSYTGHFSLKR